MHHEATASLADVLSYRHPGVVRRYAREQHVTPEQQVAYTHSPPFGGAHDGY